MLDINRLLFSELDPQGLFAAVSQSIRRLIRHDFAFLVLQETGTQRFRLHAMDGPPSAIFFKPGVTFPVEGAISKKVLQSRSPFVANGDEINAMPGELVRRAYQEGVRSMCWVPLLVGDRGLGTLCVAALETDSFSAQDVELLWHVGQQVALALENAFAFGQVSELIDKLEEEKLYLENEVGSPYRSEDIVGHSEALAYVLEQVRTVAPALATVLVLGETGTGKELIARAIHRLSDRNQGPFVKLNCAAIPTGLLESELFGHEKGAFTGAVAAESRAARTGGSRDAFPRRSRRDPPGTAAEAAASSSGTGVRAGRRQPDPPRERAHRGRDPSESGNDGAEQRVSARSLLPS